MSTLKRIVAKFFNKVFGFLNIWTPLNFLFPSQICSPASELLFYLHWIFNLSNSSLSCLASSHVSTSKHSSFSPCTLWPSMVAVSWQQSRSTETYLLRERKDLFCGVSSANAGRWRNGDCRGTMLECLTPVSNASWRSSRVHSIHFFVWNLTGARVRAIILSITLSWSKSQIL